MSLRFLTNVLVVQVERVRRRIARSIRWVLRSSFVSDGPDIPRGFHEHRNSTIGQYYRQFRVP